MLPGLLLGTGSLPFHSELCSHLQVNYYQRRHTDDLGATVKQSQIEIAWDWGLGKEKRFITTNSF